MGDELKDMAIVTRTDVLRLAKLIMEHGSPGLCCAIRKALTESGIVVGDRDIEHFFHLHKRKYAMPFLARRRKGGYWWKPGSFGVFSGRRMFLNWLIWKYRDDETNLLDL